MNFKNFKNKERSYKMSKIKDFAHDFLEQSYELDLGYDWDNLPNINDFDFIIKHKISYHVYKKGLSNG